MVGVVRDDLNSKDMISAHELNRELEEKHLKGYVELINSEAKLNFNQSVNDNIIINDLERYMSNYREILSQHNLFLDFDSYSYITDETIKRVSILSPNLKKINLKSCIGITDLAIEYLAKNCQNLEEMNLSWCDITAQSLFIIADNFPKLRRINVSSCYITDQGVHSLLSQCKNLQILGLAWCKSITDKSIESILDFSGKLKVFDIRGNEKITSQAFAKLFNNKRAFSAIHLKRCHGVDGSVITSLAKIGNNLEKLNLRGCFREHNIENQHLIELFTKCSNIKSLDLAWHEYITPETLNHLAYNCVSLESIDLSGCKLIDENSFKNLFSCCLKLSLVILFNNVLISSELVKNLGKQYNSVKIKVYN